MPVSKNRKFAKIANDIATDGTLTADGISSDVTLGGATIYATRSALPVSGNTAGDQAYVTGNNRLYIWNGSGWYNIALLNLAPAISSVQDSNGGTTPFTLSSEGAVTKITITANDSDGDPITYTASADSDFNGLATVSQDSSIFTITPFSSDSATTTSGTITFTATDGINVASSGVQTFTLSFGTDWTATTQIQRFQPTVVSNKSNWNLGSAVKISSKADGSTTAIVGAPGYDPAGATNNGAVYVYYKDSADGLFEQQGIIYVNTGATSKGTETKEIDIDKDTIVISDWRWNSSMGQVHIFHRTGSTWSEQKTNLGSGYSVTGGQFGRSVAISGDTLAVGFPRKDADNKGSVMIFERTGSTWNTTGTLITKSDVDNQAEFGMTVELDSDTGTMLVVTKEDYNGSTDNGIVYAYTGSGNSWSLQDTIQVPFTTINTRIGREGVHISGNTAVICAPGDDEDSTNKGSLYVYGKSGSSWTQQTRLVASDAINNDQFGYSASIDSDNNVIVAGSPYADSGGVFNIGAAYIFTRNDPSSTTWTEQKKITGTASHLNSNFGWAVGVSGDGIIVGSKSDSDGNGVLRAGSVYEFKASE